MATPADQQRVVKVNELDDNFLTCEICTDRFKRAKNLPCGHTFCQECLEKWAEKNKGKELTCPNCRKPWQVPADGIEKLPANYHVNSMIDYIFLSQTVDIGSGAKTCEFCESKEATSACVECRQLECDVCAKGHKRTRATANHRVVSLDEYKAYYEAQPAELKPTDCDQHPGIQLKYYCQTCSVPICSECTIIEHRVPDHQHVYLAKAAKDARNSLNETLVKVPDWLKYYDEKETNIRGVKGNLTESKKQAILNVEQHTIDLVKKIQENGKELVRTINDTYEVKEKVLDLQLDRIELAKGQVKSSFEYSKSLLQLATDAGLMSVHKQTEEKLEGLLKEEIQVEPQVNHHLQYLSDPAFENHKQGSVINNLALAHKSVVKVVAPFKEVKCQIVTYDVHGNEVKQGGAEVTFEVTTEEGEKVPSDLTDNDDGTYDITFTPAEPSTYFLDVSLFGQPVKDSPIKINSIPIPLKTASVVGSLGSGQGQFNWPAGVAVSNAGDVFVADYNNSRIQVFDINGHFKRQFSVCSQGYTVRPRGIMFTKEDQLVITNAYQYFELCLCDTDGKLLRNFGQGQIQQQPYGVAISGDGNFHVTLYGGHCVKTFIPEGKLVRTIGGQGNQPGQFTNPYGVAVNSKDQIIVSDLSNHRVQVFDSNGAFLFTFGRQGNGDGQLNQPRGVTVDRHDNIIVCDWGNHRIQAFSPNGDYMGRVDDPADGVKCPEGITTIPGQPLKLIVTEYNSNVHSMLRIM